MTNKPVKMILDTDIGPDCDDAGALAVLHTLADRGEMEILGMTHCTSNPYGAGCIDAVNIYYGRPDIPIGTLKKEGFLEDGQRYNRFIHENYPHRFDNGAVPPDAVELLRQTLITQEDDSVTMIAIGPLPNLSHLLQSGPDQHSPLTGKEMISRKISQLVVMGGEFPQGLEWNFEMDPTAAQYVCENWPTPIMFSGKEIGHPLQTGQRLYESSEQNNPVRKAYELFLGKQGTRSSYDLTAVLYGIRGLADYWSSETDGYLEVKESGESIWHGNIRRGHSYLKSKMSRDDLEQTIENLLLKNHNL